MPLGLILIFSSLLLPIFYYYFMVLFYNKNTKYVENTNFSPDLTIVLPVKNESLLINEKLAEIISFKYKGDINLLIIDSKSTDNTVPLAKIFLSGHPTISWKIEVLDIPGKSSAVNHAIDLIKTEFFLMLDVDAILESNSIQIIMRNFIDEGIGSVCGQLDISNEKSDNHYRSRFNKLRVSESQFYSTLIFEGSVCAFRCKSIGNEKINSEINADDSQLAMITIKNGYRSIMDQNVRFKEPGVDVLPQWNRKKRRAQGLIRAILLNYQFLFQFNRNTIVYLHSFYFHIIFPWIILCGMFLFIFSLFQNINYIHDLKNIEYILMVIILIFTFMFSFAKELFNGIFVLIAAQCNLIIGKKLNVWDTDRDIRKTILRSIKK